MFEHPDVDEDYILFAYGYNETATIVVVFETDYGKIYNITLPGAMYILKVLIFIILVFNITH